MAEFRLVQGLGNQVLEVVKEAYDLRDVKHDLETIVEAVYMKHQYILIVNCWKNILLLMMWRNL